MAKSPYKYKPTKIETKLLEILLDPTYVGASNAKIYQAAGITKQRFYTIMKRKGFIELVNQMNRDIIGDKIYGVLQSSYDNAINGGAKGFQDRKLLLQMYELYTDKLEHSGTINAKVEQVLSDKELKEQIEKLEGELKDELTGE